MDLSTDYVVPVLAAIAGAFAKAAYPDLKAFVLGKRGISGTWTLVGSEIKDAQGNCALFEEALKLRNNDRVLKAKSEVGDFVREYSGFTNDEYLALAYNSRGGPGTGSIVARDPSGTKKVFVGYWQGLDCTLPEKRLVKGPAILVRGTAGSAEVQNMRNRFSAFLAQRCEVVATPPFNP
ncbi:hypothetical protein HHL11_07270 [Ramlibacter sp. G-1-2-2]|uniref:Uncharacterized protein n=1 Tax=Ramlibacter agri TaxID=2728837 RepID=A0A848H4I5_9BURK|nr:hypothetical protein [Ramlibacter agri]NML43543.1 hypothetical protein [Ramlibacter agri]